MKGDCHQVCPLIYVAWSIGQEHDSVRTLIV